MNHRTKNHAVTGTASTAIPSHHAAAIALAGCVGNLQAENYDLRADNARLQHAVQSLLTENESISAGFTTLLDELEMKGQLANA